MILYQIKDLYGESGSHGGYYEYEFCKLIRKNREDLSMQFAKNEKEFELYTDRHKEPYSILKEEANLIGEF